jgi:nicotinamidase-related amidase
MDSEQPIELAAERTGLIIVDMQAEGCERHGPGLKPVIKNIRSLLDRFREAGGKIIHIQSVRAKDHPEFTFFGKSYSLLDNSPAVEFVDELKPDPSEIVVKKYSHDCFYQTTLEDRLKELDLRPCRDHVSSRESARTIVFTTRLSTFTSATTSSTSRKIASMRAKPRASSLP